ncbi:Thiamine monophosphate synthase [Rhizoctonia solani]|uniref:hydroxyethylthiazole kinase n=1 Tax=Rhizoctonia solani TaxID=456999 RepID=A0A8H7I474_9AGAM|nr:Thiamine monophosphate synthase [Rhizoctonia solani]
MIEWTWHWQLAQLALHIGQTDMPVSTARKASRIGTFNNVDEAKRAVLDGADYVGIGAVWATATKDLVKPVLGVRGLGDMLDIVGDAGIPAVAIGGIKVHNALHTLHGAVGPITGTALSGLAIATEIISAPDASIPAKALTQIINSRSSTSIGLLYVFPQTLLHRRPLLAENAGSALDSRKCYSSAGASPIMATAPEEMEDLSKVAGGLLINFGTITNKAGMLIAGKAANANKKPVVFDPVGVGATQFRRETASELLNSWQASVIKGNAGEIGALLGSSEVIARGVDSVGPGFSDPANIVRALAKRELPGPNLGCIVVMTGKTDYVSDGYSAVALSNGHSMLEDITGSGCIVGTAIAAFAAASRLIAAENTEDEGKLVRGDMFQAAVAGVSCNNDRIGNCSGSPDVKGTGTFMSALIDELYNLKPQNIADRAMVEILVEWLLEIASPLSMESPTEYTIVSANLCALYKNECVEADGKYTLSETSQCTSGAAIIALHELGMGLTLFASVPYLHVRILLIVLRHGVFIPRLFPSIPRNATRCARSWFVLIFFSFSVIPAYPLQYYSHSTDLVWPPTQLSRCRGARATPVLRTASLVPIPLRPPVRDRLCLPYFY